MEDITNILIQTNKYYSFPVRAYVYMYACELMVRN